MIDKPLVTVQRSPKYAWTRKGGYEVSTAGDWRFSALTARLDDGRTIEMHYQCDVKGYDPGGTDWRAGKGKPPKRKISASTQWKEYLILWRRWARSHPNMMDELKSLCSTKGNVLSDRFASTNINQARALAFILNEMDCKVRKDLF